MNDIQINNTIDSDSSLNPFKKRNFPVKIIFYLLNIKKFYGTPSSGLVKINDKKFLLPSEYEEKYQIKLRKINTNTISETEPRIKSDYNSFFKNNKKNFNTINLLNKSKNKLDKEIKIELSEYLQTFEDHNFRYDNIITIQSNYKSDEKFVK